MLSAAVHDRRRLVVDRGGRASASGIAIQLYDIAAATNARTIALLGDGAQVLMATAVPERQAGDAVPEIEPYWHRDQRAKVWRHPGEPKTGPNGALSGLPEASPG